MNKKIEKEAIIKSPVAKHSRQNQGENGNGQGEEGYHEGSLWSQEVGQVGSKNQVSFTK